MFYDAVKNDHGLAIDPLKAIVAPRPIAWISTATANGHANLAPYSFFNLFSEQPTYLAFGSDGNKDTLRNIRSTEDFAVNLTTYPLRDAMNVSSQSVGATVDEFDLAGLAKAPCRMIKSPRVAGSPACLECKLFRVVDLPDAQGIAEQFLVIGQVVGVHIEDRFIKNDRVNTQAMQLLARLGYSEYATVSDVWRMRRP